MPNLPIRGSPTGSYNRELFCPTGPHFWILRHRGLCRTASPGSFWRFFVSTHSLRSCAPIGFRIWIGLYTLIFLFGLWDNFLPIYMVQAYSPFSLRKNQFASLSKSFAYLWIPEKRDRWFWSLSVSDKTVAAVQVGVRLRSHGVLIWSFLYIPLITQDIDIDPDLKTLAGLLWALT